MGAESGDTLGALRQARTLLARRPESADAHLFSAYVLRYGGALDESARECDAGWELDRGNQTLRSCALTFLLLARYDRAADFIRLGGREWGAGTMALMHTMQGNLEPQSQPGSMSAGFLANNPADVDAAVARAMRLPRTDGEPFAYLAAEAAACKRPRAALDFLRIAVSLNFCTVPEVETHPIFASVRALPDYRAFRTEAVQCRNRFMAALQQ